MTGSVIVRVLEEGSDNPRTVVYLNRGETFGELGLVNRERRKSTVISRDKVELLCIADADYTRIFMAGGLQTLLDPNQSDFVRNLKFLEGWPIHLLAENPKKCVFSYFKRGDVLVKNSKKSDWILMVKSGSCSVMKLLHKKKTKEQKKRKESKTGAPDLTTEGKRLSIREGTLENYQQRKTRDELEHFLKDLNIHEEEPDNHEHPSASNVTAQNEAKEQVAQINSEETNNDVKRVYGRRPDRPVFPSQHLNVHLSRLPSYVATSGQRVINENQQTQDSQQEKRHPEQVGQRKTVATEIVDEIVTKEDDGFEQIWVRVQTLTKGSYFGLSDMLFDAQPSFSVVSNGAECILMSKKFYREHATPKMLTRLRREEQSYPDDQELQRKLENKLQWESFKKTHLFTSLKQSKKRINLQR
ncbi:uncharacterized protein LOC110984339 [Acanthaster planci]|uniref:Uncharacterized protein LOC110984339 n=1 Tax=Acanthaster planci TaxID=133434 RepID=A0A8B7Z5P3_ACAPL|nr:uncharacterized protein LOC110984339 [Acanthaster planci]